MIVDCREPFTFEMDEELITHNLDCSGYERVMLLFEHDFHSPPEGVDEIGEVDVRVDGGPWHNVAHFQSAAVEGREIIDFTYLAADRANVQIRWHYYDTMLDWYWGIDNVTVAGVVSPTVALGDFEPDCDVDFGDFAVLGARWLDTDCGDCDGVDLTGDGNIRADDLAELATYWLYVLE